MTLSVSEEVGVSQGAEAGMYWNVQKVSGPSWLRKGPRVGQCLWVRINHQVTFLTHPPLPTTISSWGHGLGWLVASFPR